MSYPYKICDPVHGFIRFGDLEQQVIDSPPFQRLRYIRQMGVAYLVYPGATHSRFEHSLGVMELVTRIYNTLIEPHNQITPLDKSGEEILYWRLILRLAALCHDMGHLPFSHTAEKSLLPEGGHEQMTLEFIASSYLRPIWKKIGPHAEADIAKLAVVPEGVTGWERVLSQIITEDNFGADRIDYLIRDGHYTGVGYGHFDYHQLIDSLRILSDALGITASGIQSVESLWIARYMMYARVYQHPKSRVYTNHMHRFMQLHYPGKMGRSCAEYLMHTDYTVLTALSESAKKGDYDANCLLKRECPFCEIPLKALPMQLVQELEKTFGRDLFIDEIPQKEICRAFPVYTEEGVCISSSEASPFLRAIPPGGKPFCLYAHPQKVDTIKQWLYQKAQLEPAL
jgi:uncharacterized protein